MQIRKLEVWNFRGTSELTWIPEGNFCCLIGSGDSGKSTILDAIEAALSSKWFSFTEPDFLGCDTTKSIVIEATVGELSEHLKSDERFGLFIRGWSKTGEINDEPINDDEPVLTVRLTVDATMEPVWELVREETENTRTLSNRDRALFGTIRLAGEDVRHLAWGQSSVLSRLSGDTNEAALRLAEAYKAARSSAELDKITSLTDGAKLAEKYARELGAYVEGHYEPGLELGRSGLSSGSIALHDQGVPLRLSGLGSRRLATLAIQKSAIAEGAILLVDEIEHGLEPHRIIGAISQLKSTHIKALKDKKPVGQTIMTTHSDVALAEAGAESLRVVSTSRPERVTELRKPEAPSPIQELLRFTPRALLARKVLVTEGQTELGLLLALREFWPVAHNDIPVEQLSAAIADGNGSQAASIALSLHALGYSVALYRDSDIALRTDVLANLASKSIQIIEYGSDLKTEEAIFQSASSDNVQRILDFARLERGDDSINSNIQNHFTSLTLDTIRKPFSTWETEYPGNEEELSKGLAEVADLKKWFKDQRVGRGLGPIVWDIANDAKGQPLELTLSAIETWLYA